MYLTGKKASRIKKRKRLNIYGRGNVYDLLTINRHAPRCAEKELSKEDGDGPRWKILRDENYWELEALRWSKRNGLKPRAPPTLVVVRDLRRRRLIVRDSVGELSHRGKADREERLRLT